MVLKRFLLSFLRKIVRQIYRKLSEKQVKNLPKNLPEAPQTKHEIANKPVRQNLAKNSKTSEAHGGLLKNM